MKVLGFVFLITGWLIVLCTLLLLGTRSARGAFVLSGIVVQLLGLGLMVRAHMVLGEENR